LRPLPLVELPVFFAAAEVGAELGLGLAAAEGAGVGGEARGVGIAGKHLAIDAADDGFEVARVGFFAAAESVAELEFGPAGIEKTTAIKMKTYAIGIAVKDVAVGSVNRAVGVAGGLSAEGWTGRRGLNLKRGNGAVPSGAAGLAERVGGEVRRVAVEPGGGTAELGMLEESDAHGTFETDGAEAIVEGAAAWIADEHEVFDGVGRLDDEVFSAKIPFGVERSAADGRSELRAKSGGRERGTGENAES
jgi:hypothetical protein